MAKNKRRVYGDDGGEESPVCPECGCRHMEARKMAADKRSITFRVTCRYCGWETARTVGIEIAKPPQSDARAGLDERGDDDD